jgi:hypothetical protein
MHSLIPGGLSARPLALRGLRPAGAPSRSTTSSSAPRGLGLRSRPPSGALSAVPCPDGGPLRARSARHHSTRRRAVHLRRHPRPRQADNRRVAENRATPPRWQHRKSDALANSPGTVGVTPEKDGNQLRPVAEDRYPARMSCCL